MQSILFAGAIQAIFLAILIITKRNKERPDYVLFALLLIASFPLLFYFFNFDSIIEISQKYVPYPTYMYFVNMPYIMLPSPLIYIYIKSSMIREKNFIRKNFFHFLPTLIFIVLTFILVDIQGIKKQGFFVLSKFERILFMSFAPLALFLTFFYINKSFVLVKKHQQKIKENFSYTENIDFHWLKILLLSYAISMIIVLPSVFILTKYLSIAEIYQIVLLYISSLVFFVGFFGIKQSNIFIFSKQQNTKNQQITQHHLNKDTKESSAEVKKLLEFMENEKIYLNSKLSLAQLAEKLNWQPSFLSKILNEKLNKNFYEFVNYYRAEEAKKQLIENENYTILAVAFDCGFNSKSSFHRIFKEFTGKTPGEYKKAIKSNNKIIA
jgi:AraC-like DNA-binding protein